jgi:SPP1 family predicted phage head-tail adaptor
MIRIGDMRHQIRIEERSLTQDASGERVATWSTFVERRASVERAPGSEVWSSAQRNARVPTLFKIRYHAGVVPGMRLIHESRTYDILSAIDQKGMRQELLISAQELVDG